MKSIVQLVICVAVCLAAGALGSVFTARSVSTWYAELAKPPFNPPGWVFGPVWTTLYVMMAVSLWLVWRQGLERPWAKAAVAAFAVQLVLNVAWSGLFFGLRQPGIAFLEIIALWIAIALTGVLFWPFSKTASLLLAPYLAWVSFATVLNFELWRLNR